MRYHEHWRSPTMLDNLLADAYWVRLNFRSLSVQALHGDFNGLVFPMWATPQTSPLHVNKPMPRKKSKKPFKSLTTLALGIPTNIAIGPLGFRAALEADPIGERNRSYHRELDRPDLTAILDGSDPEPSRIEFCEREGEAQESHAPGTSTAVPTHDIEQGHHSTSECYESLPPRPMFIRISVPLPIRRNHRQCKTGR